MCSVFSVCVCEILYLPARRKHTYMHLFAVESETHSVTSLVDTLQGGSLMRINPTPSPQQLCDSRANTNTASADEDLVIRRRAPETELRTLTFWSGIREDTLFPLNVA